MAKEGHSFAHRAKVLILGDEATSKAERKLVQKLDFFILTYCCLSFFFNYLDRAAFANAYVAGLKEDLNLKGNNYNVLLSMTTAGYMVGQIPHGIVIQKVAPRIWFPSMVVIWAGLTMCSAACKTFSQLCAVRFFQGLIEASTYCGTLYILGSWYKPREIAKRTAIFTASGNAGQMFAGIMMTAIYKGMNGHAGLAGWQWVFLLDGVITLPIAIMGYMYFPDTPETTKAPYLNAEERALAMHRLPHAKRADGHNISPLSLAKRVFSSPAFYVLCAFGVLGSALEAFCSQGLFLLWLKNHKAIFSQTAITSYPLGIQAVAIMSNLLSAVYMDTTGKRVPMGILAGALQLTSAVILAVPNVSNAATFFAYYNAGTSYIVNPLLFGWANVILQRGGDDAKRSVILGSINMAAQILNTFWGIVLYPADDAPYWRNGSIAMIVVVAGFLGMLMVVKWLDVRTAKQWPDQQLVEDLTGEDVEAKSVTENRDSSLELKKLPALDTKAVA